ncbi:hypothetical protein ACX4E6_003250, partial [Cronobacter sakazakii]
QLPVTPYIVSGAGSRLPGRSLHHGRALDKTAYSKKMSSHRVMVLGFNTLARNGLKFSPTTPKDVVSLRFNRRRPVVDNGTGYPL